MQRGFQVPFALAQRFFHSLTLRDVFHHCEVMERYPIFVANDGSREVDPKQFFVFAKITFFERVPACALAQGFGDILIVFNVVRMSKVQRILFHQLFRGVTQHLTS